MIFSKKLNCLFCIVVVEMLIEHSDHIFDTIPHDISGGPPKPVNSYYLNSAATTTAAVVVEEISRKGANLLVFQ